MDGQQMFQNTPDSTINKHTQRKNIYFNEHPCREVSLLAR